MSRVFRVFAAVGLCVVLGLASTSVSGCSFVRSSKLKPCKEWKPPIIDMALFLVLTAGTGVLAGKEEYGYMLATMPVTLGFLISGLYGLAKYSPQPGYTCARSRRGN